MTLRPKSERERVTAGKRNRRITILRLTTTEDPGSGQQIEAWSPLSTEWASWRRASAREQLAASEISATVTDVFELAHTSVTASVTPLDRVEYEGCQYNLEEVTEIGFREGVMLRGNARGE